MKIKKRYIKEEIERLEKQQDSYFGLIGNDRVQVRGDVLRLQCAINALEWVLGFADD